MWRHEGEGSWYFVTVPEEISDEITDLSEGRRKGFGSVRVAVTIGDSNWRTSVFPTKTGTYVLPIKKPVRLAEELVEGIPVDTRLELVDF
nr:DUF1905 domain-containing protein [Kribbella shirazensis]